MKRIIFILIALTVICGAQECKNEDKLTIQPYGFFKLDMSYDSDLMSVGNFARWATPNSGDAIPTTNITAKQSRFGLNINKGNISGKVEIDFYGAGSTENKGAPMLRKAYAEAKFDGFSIRAGQDSDVISPLVPSTINYPVAWWAGDIGYRRPMLKLFGNLNSINWTLALARNIGGDLNDDGINDGSAGLLPELQGRLAFTLLENYNLGFSGHFAQLDAVDEGKYESWSANLDLNIKFSSMISLSGEAFVGNNTARMLGGIGNASTVDGVETQGGWVNLKVKPNAKHSFSVGFSMDDPCDCDLNDGARSKNTMVFANVYHDILEGFLIGFEISNWTTEYKNMDTASALRGQFAFLYKF